MAIVSTIDVIGWWRMYALNMYNESMKAETILCLWNLIWWPVNIQFFCASLDLLEQFDTLNMPYDSVWILGKCKRYIHINVTTFKPY